jgi:hypothetical protein
LGRTSPPATNPLPWLRQAGPCSLLTDEPPAPADALKDNNDLVMQLAAKYDIEKARRDVDALMQSDQI